MNPNDYLGNWDYKKYLAANTIEFWEDFGNYFEEKDRAQYIENPILYLIHLKERMGLPKGFIPLPINHEILPDFNDESFCNCHHHQYMRSKYDDGMG